jgi:hypothetical protein
VDIYAALLPALVGETIGLGAQQQRVTERAFRASPYPPLQLSQTPVDQKGADAGRYLGHASHRQTRERGGQGLAQIENPLEARQAISICCLTPCRRLEDSVSSRMPY